VTMKRAHPYMANSTAEARTQMLEAIGVDSVDELFEQIPADHISSMPDLPPALDAEVELRRHLTGLLSKNVSCEENLNFLGAGVWQHHVPAICDEIWSRAEFLTNVWGTGSSDLGRNQAWFEYASQLGELVGMEFVGLPVYSWGAAVGHAARMAARLTGRNRLLVPEGMDPERLRVLAAYCGEPSLRGHIEVATVRMEPSTGRIDLEDLTSRLSDEVAAVYFENPSYLGIIESDAREIALAVRRVGAETIVGVDPISLGVLAAPGGFGADIVVGTTQTLGVHMNCGGGVGGFIATRDEEAYARQYPTLQVSICGTSHPGERGFGMTLFGQSSYGSRELGNDWTGNSVYLWAIVNAAYMALMGPQGFVDVGAAILRRSYYAAARIAEIAGLEVVWPSGFFKEFVVNLDGTGLDVATINDRLLDRGIFGGMDLTDSHPSLGRSALFCVTEVHSRSDIDRLVDALGEVTA
jgi:glycine dehydrogenase subunit 1